MLAGAIAVSITAVAVPALAAGPGRHPLNGSTPRWLHRAHDLGATPSAQQVSFGVLLRMRDQGGAAASLSFPVKLILMS